MKNPIHHPAQLHITEDQSRFLGLFRLAAQYDCMYLLSFHCMDMFGHDSIAALTNEQTNELEAAARKDIMRHAIASGYRPDHVH